MTTKPKSSGGITQKGPNKWLVRVFLGRDSNGKTLYHNKTVRGTKKDAIRYRNRIRTEHDSGTFVEPSRQSVLDFLSKWLNTTVKARVRQKTFDDYKRHIEQHLAPAFGGHRLGQLQPAEIQKLYTAMSARYSSRTVRYVHSVLHSALEQAVKWGEIARNPARLVTLPQAKSREMKCLNAAELVRFINAAKESRFYALWLLLATTGMRPGEALALRWSDRDGNRLRIQRALCRSSAGWSFEEPKTDRSRRSVPLPSTTVEALDQLRRQQVAERLSAGPEYENLDLVFATQHGQPLEWRVVARRHFKPILKKAGLPPIRPYDLRHSHATLLLGVGEHPRIVAERLGHSSTTMTMDVYSHVLPDMQERTAEKIEGLLFGAIASA